jgi:hypothetical protein
MTNELLAKMESGAELSETEKKELFREMGQNSAAAEELRRDFAIMRGEILRPVLRQQSLIRNIFRETPTNGEQIAFPVRSKKIRSAWYMASISSTPQRTQESDEVYIPTWHIRGGARWPLAWMKTGNVDLVTEQENDTMDEVIFKENLAGWSLIKAAVAATDIQTITGTQATFTVDAMLEIITKCEEQEDRRKITDIYLSPKRYNEIAKWAQLNVSQLDDVTRREVFVGGPESVSMVLKSWGVAFHKVYDADFVDNRFAYCFDSSKFGRMPIDVPWETQNDDQAKMTWEAGWFGQEKVGFGILDTPSACVYDFA